MRRLMKNSTALALSLAVALPPAAFARGALENPAAPANGADGLPRYAQAAATDPAPVTEGEAELLLKKKLEEAQKAAAEKAEAAGKEVKPVEPAAKTPEAPKVEEKPAADVAKPDEQKPAEDKPEAKSAEPKPAPSDARPAAEDPAKATKPAPAENKPEPVKPADTNPVKPAAAPAATDTEPLKPKPAEATATDSKPPVDAKASEAPKPPAADAKPTDAPKPPATDAKPAPAATTAPPAQPAVQTEAKPAADTPAAPPLAENPPALVPGKTASGKTAAPAAPVAVPEANATLTDTAKAAAAAAAAPVAAALAADAKPEGETLETKITDALSRKSSEEFATNVSGGQPAGTEAKSDKKGLSDLESIALGGLAALAVGQLVNNRPVALNTGDRVVVQNPDGSQQIIKNDNTLLFQPGSTVETQNFADGSSRTTVTRADGSKVVTIRDANYDVLRRTLVAANGTTTELIDDTIDIKPVEVTKLPPPAKPVVIAASQQMTEADLRRALEAQSQIDRRFTLGQIRSIPEVRALVAPVDIPAITFDTGSAAITSDQAKSLSGLGKTISAFVKENPREIFMIEGYTDTVGAPAMNLALSDRRAESVALALTEYFGVPPENMVVQGYGESYLRVPVEGDVRENRRVAVRRVTDLMDHK